MIPFESVIFRTGPLVDTLSVIILAESVLSIASPVGNWLPEETVVGTSTIGVDVDAV